MTFKVADKQYGRLT